MSILLIKVFSSDSVLTEESRGSSNGPDGKEDNPPCSIGPLQSRSSADIEKSKLDLKKFEIVLLDEKTVSRYEESLTNKNFKNTDALFVAWAALKKATFLMEQDSFEVTVSKVKTKMTAKSNGKRNDDLVSGKSLCDAQSELIEGVLQPRKGGLTEVNGSAVKRGRGRPRKCC